MSGCQSRKFRLAAYHSIFIKFLNSPMLMPCSMQTNSIIWASFTTVLLATYAQCYSREVYFMRFLKLPNSCFRIDRIMNRLLKLFLE